MDSAAMKTAKEDTTQSIINYGFQKRLSLQLLMTMQQ
jgi:hypothetical protein